MTSAYWKLNTLRTGSRFNIPSWLTKKVWYFDPMITSLTACVLLRYPASMTLSFHKPAWPLFATYQFTWFTCTVRIPIVAQRHELNINAVLLRALGKALRVSLFSLVPSSITYIEDLDQQRRAYNCLLEQMSSVARNNKQKIQPVWLSLAYLTTTPTNLASAPWHPFRMRSSA